MSGILSGFAGGGFGATSTSLGIEDVFSTYLYTGNGSTQNITNGIDLAGKGGLVWIKSRSAATNNNLFDTAQGATKLLHSNTTAATVTDANSLTAFGTTGFTLGSGNTSGNQVNTSAATYVSWAFRKQAKFFDIVTWTGTGDGGTEQGFSQQRTIPHSLGSTPGCIIVKGVDGIQGWFVWHQSISSYLLLDNTTGSSSGATDQFTNTMINSTSFTLASGNNINNIGSTYVAYLFATNAGGFGLTGSDNVITCGSFTSTGTGVGNDVVVNLGYEVQYVLAKADNVSNWQIYDTMRGLSVTGTRLIYPNLSDAEVDGGSTYSIEPTATGFTAKRGLGWGAGTRVIYIAIRRGPMKVPTVGSSVFSPVAYTGTGGSNRFISTSFTPDFVIGANRTSTYKGHTVDRLRGQRDLVTNTSAADSSLYDGLNLVTTSNGLVLDASTGGSVGYNISSNTYVNWLFKRAPGFFDVVAYTGDGSLGRDIPHSLKVTPEIIFVKRRNSTQNWIVNLGTTLATNINLFLNTTDANVQSSFGVAVRFSTADTFHVGGSTTYDPNISGATYVAYLFATCPGVSKVGSYTGTGATQTINCGFTDGARFVLVKRTDSTGDWYVWDTARGMVSGTDPSLLLNSTAAEVNANSVYTTGGGFQIVSTAAGINASGGTYIFLAIA